MMKNFLWKKGKVNTVGAWDIEFEYTGRYICSSLKKIGILMKEMNVTFSNF